MRVMVTGAAGLLGRCVVAALAPAHEVLPTVHTRPFAGAETLELTDGDAVTRYLTARRPTHIVHCAAIRSPEACLQDPVRAYAVNAAAVEFLARGAQAAEAHLLHVSTDYVFPGDAPPYREDDPCAPVNLYGRSKRAGERAAALAPRHTIARIPALYRLDLEDGRNVAAGLADRLAGGEALTLDAGTVRYYTLADDIAAAIRFLLETGVEGTIHLSAQTRTSKADFARRLAEALGLPPGRVLDGPPETGGDRRPHDTHLDTGRYASLGGPALRGLDQALARLAPSAKG